MDILVTILLVLATTIVLVLLVAAFMKNDYIIERDIVIDQPKQKVFDYIKQLKNQDHFNKWVMLDPNSRKTFTGTDGTKGFIYAWDSDNKQAGKGEQEIKAVKEGERIDYEVRFEKPFKGTSAIAFTTETVSANQTKVRWTFTGARTYLLKIIHLVFNLQKVLGNDMATSLANLKQVLSK
jgi:uncharacterized protein YndB with AHSA1/START domain